ncbi:MAG: EAL domain-containing protein, partial [Gammaproteobacteria bacterium]
VQPLFQVLVLVSDAAANAETELYQTRANLLDPDKNIIEAKEFIPVFEKTNTLKTFDRWMIRYCIGELAKLNENEDEKFAVFIALSEQSLNDKGLSDWINKLLEYVKMPKLGSALIFEINAENFLEQHRQAKIQINKLRVKLGASIALTDIQNIAMLEDCLQQEKFDFIMFSPEHIIDGKMEQEDIQAMAAKAKENNSLSIASKIDSGEYLAMAASVGVDYVLGHFVQPPMENIVASDSVEVTDR